VSYAVVWNENGGPLYAGRLDLTGSSVRLAGKTGDSQLSRWRLAYDQLADVHVERRPASRLRSRPTLVLERTNGGPIRVVSVEGAGSLHELAERLEVARERAGP